MSSLGLYYHLEALLIDLQYWQKHTKFRKVQGYVLKVKLPQYHLKNSDGLQTSSHIVLGDEVGVSVMVLIRQYSIDTNWSSFMNLNSVIKNSPVRSLKEDCHVMVITGQMEEPLCKDRFIWRLPNLPTNMFLTVYLFTCWDLPASLRIEEVGLETFLWASAGEVLPANISWCHAELSWCQDMAGLNWTRRSHLGSVMRGSCHDK